MKRSLVSFIYSLFDPRLKDDDGMTSRTPLRDSAFISYSHKDRALLEQFQAHLKPLIRDHNLRVWDDTNIKPGDTWKAEIERAIASARVAVLLISRSFLASDFIAGEELPKLLKAAKDEGARILPVILSPSVFQYTPLSQFQTVNDPARPLSAMSEHQQEEVWAKLAIEVYQTLTAPYPIGTTLITYTGHTDRVNTVAWSPNGKHIASVGTDGTGQIWNATSGSTVWGYQNLDAQRDPLTTIRTLCWAPDGKRIAAGGNTPYVKGAGIVLLLDPSSGRHLYSYFLEGDYAVEMVGWSPQGKWLAAAVNRFSYETEIVIWDDDTRQAVIGPILGRAFAWSPNGNYLALGTEHVTIWDAASRKMVLTYPRHVPDVNPDDEIMIEHGWVDALAWSSDGKLIASDGYNNADQHCTVEVWDATTAQHLYTYTSHSGPVTAIAWSSDGKRIASASWDKTVQIWDAATAQHLYTYTGHTSPVTSVAWSPDGTRIASASWDKTVQVWSAG